MSSRIRLAVPVLAAALAVSAGTAGAQGAIGGWEPGAAPGAQVQVNESLPPIAGADKDWNAQFDRTYVRLLAAAPYRPSILALRLALAEGSRGLASLPPGQAAALALSCALEIERDIRFGASPQEARAFIRLYLRSSASAAGRNFVEAYGRDFVRGAAAVRSSGAGPEMGGVAGLGPSMAGGGRGRGE